MLYLTYNTAAWDTPYLLPFKDLHHMHCLTVVFIFGLTIFLKGKKQQKNPHISDLFPFKKGKQNA